MSSAYNENAMDIVKAAKSKRDLDSDRQKNPFLYYLHQTHMEKCALGPEGDLHFLQGSSNL